MRQSQPIASPLKPTRSALKIGVNMLDVIFLGAGIGLFVLGIIYLFACARV